MDKKITESLINCPVIAAVKNEMFSAALESPVQIIFLLNAGILNVKQQIEKAHAKGKKVFVHIDLAEGIGKDTTGIDFLKLCGVDGIVSTKAGIVRHAKEKGLATVQRIFALDSQGVTAAQELIKAGNFDFVEIMPGIATKVIKKAVNMNVPVIAGGLIEEKSELIKAIGAGAIAVSTGKKELWYT